MKYILASLLIVLIVLFGGCPSPPVVKKEVPPPASVEKKPVAPEMTFIYGSIDLAGFHGRIESSDIGALAQTVQREKIDILSVEGIVRFPGVSTRTDFVDGFSDSAGMRPAFGETATLNYRQGGNAVFSLFPIRTTENTHYTEMVGLGFESALQAIIDCGLRDVVIVSTHLPDKPGVDQETSAMGTFSRLTTSYVGYPVIISGNLPHTAVIDPPAAFVALPVKQQGAPALWYTRDSSLTVVQSKTEMTVFGRMLILQFSLHRAKGQ